MIVQPLEDKVYFEKNKEEILSEILTQDVHSALESIPNLFNISWNQFTEFVADNMLHGEEAWDIFESYYLSYLWSQEKSMTLEMYIKPNIASHYRAMYTVGCV